jgi:hypothetical protein
MIIISRDIVLARTPATIDLPLIGWDNLVTISNVAATSADTDHPASNVANPATNLYWLATSAAQQYLTVTLSGDDVSYLGVAGHNFGTEQIAVSAEAYIDSVWTELADPAIPANDQPLMIYFDTISPPQIRLRMQAGDGAARAAVLYVGEALVMERKLYADHCPMPYARKTDVANGVSESGQFLGRIVTRETRESAAKFSLLTPAFARASLEPFLAQAKETPFFFAWRPDTYSADVGYAWLINDPRPTPAGPSNLVTVDLQMGGVA